MKAFKTYHCSGLNMRSNPSLNDLLQESLEVSRLTQNASTYRGRRRSVEILRASLAESDIESLNDLEASPLSVAAYITQLSTYFADNLNELAYNTLSQLYTQMCVIMAEIGASRRTTTMLRNSKQRVLCHAEPITYPQETVTQQQMERIMRILNQLMGNETFAVKNVTTSKRKKAMLRLYILLAACYALRQGSILQLSRQDFNERNLTYRIQKGARTGENVIRTMHPLVWEAYQEYLKHIGDYSLFTDASWLSAGVKVIMQKVGVEARNGRHGIHRFRRAFATYCYTENIPLVDAAAGLNHADSVVTERVYQDINTKQQRANQHLVDFADNFLGVAQRLSEYERQLQEMTPWMADIFMLGQPNFDDEAPMELLFIDANGTLVDHDRKLVPAPRLELGTP